MLGAAVLSIILIVAGEWLNTALTASIPALPGLRTVAAFVQGVIFPLVPVAGIALPILRHRLYDIDIIIRRTITYTILTVLLLAVYFGGVVLLQQVFVGITGQRSEAAIILSTLAIAALIVPLRNRIQSVIDRRFFRRKYDAAKVLESFARTARDEVDPQQLTAKLLDAVEETMQPERVEVWLGDDGQRRAARRVEVGDESSYR
jgi:hypothetical protein